MPVQDEERSEQVMIRMAKTEVRMLEELAAADGLYRTDVVRLLIRREHAARFGAQPSGKRNRSAQK